VWLRASWNWQRENLRAGLIYGRAVRFYPSGGERDYDQAHEYTALPDADIFVSLFEDSWRRSFAEQDDC